MSIRFAVPLVVLLGACAAGGEPPSFRDLQAERAAIEAALAADVMGVARAWHGPDGAAGEITVLGPAPDDDACRRVRAVGPGGGVEDTFCPTKHGYWVHPEEDFQRAMTGRESFGGAARSGGLRRAEDGAPGTKPLNRRHCLTLDRESSRLAKKGFEGRARAARRAFHRCLHRGG